jgi:hypothetical protein
MEFGGRPDGPGGNDGKFGGKGIYAKLSAYSTNNKGLRSTYNRKLETCLRAVAEVVTLEPDVRKDIAAQVHRIVNHGRM